MIFIDTGTVHHVSIYTVAKTSVEFRVSHVMTNQERNKVCSNLALYPQVIVTVCYSLVWYVKGVIL